MDSMQDFLYEELRDIYDAEKQLTKALPKMVKSASSDELKSALQEHLDVTERQVSRLEEVFSLLGLPAKGKPCHGMKGLIEEGKEIMEEDAEDPFHDAAMIGAAQKVEHYEIAAYGTARTLAEMMENQEVADLLQETLDEEKEADEKLTEICEDLLRSHAESADMEEEEEEMERPRAFPAARVSQKSQGSQKKRRAS
jgi:ferritin-like metal-binding protein YciE